MSPVDWNTLFLETKLIIMANHKSAIKRHRQSLKRRDRNRSTKSAVRSALKKAEAAATTGSTPEATELARKAESLMASACSKGLYHKATVARKISRLNAHIQKNAQ